MNSLKVAVIVTSLSNKGPIRVVQGIVGASRRLALPVDFIVFYLKPVKELSMDCPVEQYHAGVDLSAFDVVHTHGIKPDGIAYWRRREIKRHMLTVHNLVFRALTYEFNGIVSAILGRIWVFLWRRADLLVGISGEVQAYYSGYSFARKMTSIYNGIPEVEADKTIDDSDVSAINSFRNSGLRTMGTACAVNPGKGIDMVIDLLHKRPDLQFILVGDGNAMESIRQQAKHLQVEDRCLFLGYRSEATRYFKYFDVFVMPSRAEGFGLTLLEAARAWVPIVCSDISTFREIFNDQQVRYFELEQTSSLSAAIDQALMDRDRLTESAWQKFQACYTDEIMARKYFAEYKKLSRERSA
jgi:glycosyltransferase involved in cell wall biosynthesis